MQTCFVFYCVECGRRWDAPTTIDAEPFAEAVYLGDGSATLIPIPERCDQCKAEHEEPGDENGD
jgi:hypothetical protein